MMRVVLVALALSLAGIFAVTLSAHADDGSSAIRGRLEEGGVGSDGGALVLVVPTDSPQPISVELEYGPGIDEFLEIPTDRSGPGLVRTGSAYGYAVTDLKPGRYFVGSTADFAGYGAILPPIEIDILMNGQPSSMYAYEVTLEADTTLMVNFELGSQYPDTPGRFEVCAFTYDPITFEEGIPDSVTAVTIEAVDNEGDTTGVGIAINANGCAQFNNLPRGEYAYTLVTESGSTFNGNLTVRGGEDGHLEQFRTYVRVDGPIEQPNLPHSGVGHRSDHPSALLAASLALLVTGTTATVAGARLRKQPCKS
jgi:hypothetical protein